MTTKERIDRITKTISIIIIAGWVTFILWGAAVWVTPFAYECRKLGGTTYINMTCHKVTDTIINMR